jgi:hypothetical protein
MDEGLDGGVNREKQMGTEEDKLRRELQDKSQTLKIIKWAAIVIVGLFFLRSCESSHPSPKPEDYETMREYKQATRDYDEARKDAEHEARQNW